MQTSRSKKRHLMVCDTILFSARARFQSNLADFILCKIQIFAPQNSQIEKREFANEAIKHTRKQQKRNGSRACKEMTGIVFVGDDGSNCCDCCELTGPPVSPMDGYGYWQWSNNDGRQTLWISKTHSAAFFCPVWGVSGQTQQNSISSQLFINWNQRMGEISTTSPNKNTIESFSLTMTYQNNADMVWKRDIKNCRKISGEQTLNPN